jgi:radical SAM protein with 4Fe4S-binding SPASM domain
MNNTARADSVRQLNKKQLPHFAILEVTQRCNLQCIHCYVNRRSQADELSLNEIFSVLRQLADIETYDLLFTGGEPLMHKHFFEMAGYARKLGFDISIYTNATLITEEIADRLEELRPSLIKATLYGHNENVYKKITGRSKMFHTAIAGLRALSTRKIPVKVIPCPFFNFLSIQDIKAICRIIDRLGLKRPFPSPNFVFFPKKDGGGPEPLKYDIADESKYEACFCAFPRPPIKLFPLNRDLNKGICNYLLEHKNGIFINAYGRVGNCQLAQSKESIREKSLLEIWKNDPLIKGIRELTWKDMTDCLNCESRQYCKPCPAYNFCVTKSLTKPAESWCRRIHMEKRIYEKHGLKAKNN